MSTRRGRIPTLCIAHPFLHHMFGKSGACLTPPFDTLEEVLRKQMACRFSKGYMIMQGWCQCSLFPTIFVPLVSPPIPNVLSHPPTLSHTPIYTHSRVRWLQFHFNVCWFSMWLDQMWMGLGWSMDGIPSLTLSYTHLKRGSCPVEAPLALACNVQPLGLLQA